MAFPPGVINNVDDSAVPCLGLSVSSVMMAACFEGYTPNRLASYIIDDFIATDFHFGSEWQMLCKPSLPGPETRR